MSAVFSPQRQMPIQVLPRCCFEAVILLGCALGAFLELGQIFGSPPHLHIAVQVVLGALIVEAVRHLVANHHANPAKVHCGSIALS